MTSRLRPIQLVLSMLLVAVIAGAASGEQIKARSAELTPRFVQAELLTQPPVITPAMRAQREAMLDDLYRLRQRLEPRRLSANPNVSTQPLSAQTLVQIDAGNPPVAMAPSDFDIYRNTAMASDIGSGNVSSTNEPSLGMSCGNVFYTGNWYASLSTDYGQNFSFINPYSFFTGFCCDQVAYYEESRDLTFWYLQQGFSFSGNTVRLAVTDNPAGASGSFWAYDITPAVLGFSSDVNFDYPDLSVSNNNLYIMTNAFSITPSDTSFAAGVFMRISLDQLAAAGGLTVGYLTIAEGTPRPSHGATTTMYFGTKPDDSTMRIYSWAEGSGTVNVHDEGITQYFYGPSDPGPDGTDWLDFADSRTLAGWVAGGIVGFMWNSAAGGLYPEANVRWARFNEAGLGLASEGAVWSSTAAWAYPSVHPNDSGELGGVIYVGNPYPNLQAWIADSYNGGALAPLENAFVASSTDGPIRDRWGDYSTTRMNWPYSQTWVAGGHVLNGGQTNSDADPHFVWFGREEDTPVLGPQITCPTDANVECLGSCGVPKGDASLAAFFAGVSATVDCGSYMIGNDAPDCFPLGTTTVTFTATDDGGETDQCMADVTVADTTPPVVTCPPDTTVECSAHCGVPWDDPQLTGYFDLASATDLCDVDPDITNDRPDFFPLGTTTVEYIATDGSGNADTCYADVTVVDTTPPEIEVTVDPDALWPPNHKYVCITATVVVTDICDPDPAWVLESITSSDPDNGKGDGNTINDIAEADTGTADVEFKLRSERSGKYEGRKYTIIYRATDVSANVAWDTACVFVPHDQGAGALAFVGFNPTGTGFALGARELGVFVLSHRAVYDEKSRRELLIKPALDASAIDVSRAYIGNTAGFAKPIKSRVIDINQDGLDDLMLTYRIEPVRAIKIASESITPEMIAAGAIWDGPVGLHVWGTDMTGFLVNDIFALGAPVTRDLGDDIDPRKELPTLDAASGPETPERFDNGIASIHPNPFNPRTTVRFTLAEAADVTIAVYDVSGKLVRTLVSGQMPAGEHIAEWDGTDLHGNGVATGVYFARMVAGQFTETRKMVLLK